MVEQGTFRKIILPHKRTSCVLPLRDRKEDILWFASLFLEQFAAQHGMRRKSIHPGAEPALLDYPWPGNVRELKHVIERACILVHGDVLGADALFEDGLPAPAVPAPDADLSQYLQSCERRYIISALDRHGWRMGDTALALGISRKNLWEKIKKLDIQAGLHEGCAIQPA
jgi:DNA-binding NtrC family response regulator